MEFKDLPKEIQEIAAHALHQRLNEVELESATKKDIDNMARNVRDAFTGLYFCASVNKYDSESAAKKIAETTVQNINTKPTEEEIDQFAHDAGLKNKKEKSPYAGNMFVYDNLIRIRGEIPTEYLARIHQALRKNLEMDVFDGNTNGSFVVSGPAGALERNVATWLFSNKAAALEAAACICDLLRADRKYNLDVYNYIYAEHYPLWINW
ncbi:TPA: hypothetical protein ACNPV2_003982 [Escherichia coli]|uniref:hypothetical protein n=1 Tax=Escherichia TaxID=561 RepID=UPI0018D008AD|nr:MULTISPECIES: hypothetical protein [Escherichia]EGS5034771.1 hypothetical protein [Escherichia coli]EJW9336402.1 hypothetical protein [Escherichia coli]MDK6271794.1 hypothetical protein [Escherichia coli]BDI41720.1 hypothetical protein EsCd1HHP024_02482 [Escherichia sp. HH091_1A]HAP3107320.1 hypothetical protein [Escherichia coli]